VRGSEDVGARPAEVIDLSALPATKTTRWLSGNSEVDRVLGGGLIPGALILLGGEPGAGKSTLAAQIADHLARQDETGGAVIYVSGEESAAQVKVRLERLGCSLSKLKFASETNIEKITATAAELKPRLLILDSIQTAYSGSVLSEPGSLNQIRACAVKLLEGAKHHDYAAIIIGHITKDGQIAGPKSLEHIVDTVLYLEADPGSNYSILRASKNRFGTVNELGVLEMTASGFEAVANPAAVFLAAGEHAGSGSVVGAAIEGSRPFLVDIQALVAKTIFGYPQRKASGFDLNRLQVLTTVLSRRQRLNLAAQDVIINVVGGMKISDPALDAAVCLAIASSLLNQPVPRSTVVIGEVGLGGELRPVSRLETRLAEAEKLGFKVAAIPAGQLDKAKNFKKLEIISGKNVAELIDKILVTK
jgi:DNA repair protein RadA/Sms